LIPAGLFVFWATMKLTYYGHACVGIELACGTRLLFDPFISPNGLAKAIDVDTIPADYVLLTHGHEDHVADAERILRRTGATLVSNFEIVSWYGAKGIEKAHPMNLGGGFNFPFGRVKSVNAVHSSVLPDGSYGGNPGGFVIETPHGSFYVSGDTALHADMKLLGEMHTLDFAVMCIGDNFTMGPSDAALAAEWVGAKHVVGVHYDTFPPIVIDRKIAAGEFTKRGVELLLPAIGETMAM
jgi:L-ascorbate metabolism protein UlaG (beta-lactamase superfamily)